MYKMLVMDLDGTLLDDDKKIPEINLDAIEILQIGRASCRERV